MLLDRIPALKKLDKNYINGAGFLSYHESEIMMRTLEICVEQQLPAYPVHDCLIVKQSDVTEATDVFRSAIRSYLTEQGQETISIALSIEANGEKQRLPGSYG